MGPPAVAGQTAPPDASSAIEVRGFVGVLNPLSNLTANPETFGTVVNPDVALGAEATVWLSRRVGLSATGLYSPADLAAVATQVEVELPEDVGGATYVAGLVSLTYRIVSSGSSGAIEPYFSLGGGVRRLSLDDLAEPEAESATDPALTIAGGLRIPLSEGLLMGIEVRDVASRYDAPAFEDSRLQNDIVIILSFGFR